MPATPGSSRFEVIRSVDERSESSIRGLLGREERRSSTVPPTSPACAELERRRRVCRTSLAQGNPARAVVDCARVVDMRLAHGDRLEDVAREVRALQSAAEHARCVGAVGLLRTQLQFINAVQNASAPAAMEPGTEELDAPGDAALPLVRAWRSVRTLQALSLRGEHRRAADEAVRARALLDSIDAAGLACVYHLFAGLAHAALVRDGGDARRASEHGRELAAHEEALARAVTGGATDSVHAHALIAAERARLAGDVNGAIQLYEQAIRSAHDNGVLQAEALAFEVASAFYQGLGLQMFADVYLREARCRYLVWGAYAKVRALDERAPHLVHVRGVPVPSSAEAGVQPADASLLEAARVLSSETVRWKLLHELTRILVEQSGARRGAFISVDADLRWALECSTSPLLGLPGSIVERVARSRERVLLHDATLANPYSADPYIESKRPRSVLCFPIVRHGSLIGLVYLENELAPAVFTDDKLAVLELLSEQAGISLENAKLHGDQLHEISERQQAEATLRSILDNIVDAVYVCDRHGRITLMNPAGRRILGAPERADGTISVDEIEQRVHPLHRDGSPFTADELPLMRALAGEVLSSVDVTSRVPGTPRSVHLRLSAAPLQDERGAIAGAVAVGVNVTEAVELDRLKEQFIRVVAHELKTPVAIVKGYADVLRRINEPIPGVQRRLLTALIRGADRIDRLVTDLLILWQLQTGRLALASEDRVDLVELVEGVVARFEPEAGRRVSVTGTPPVVVAADRQLLERAVCGLVDNAVRYSPDGRDVDVRIAIDGQRAQLVVEDHGIGIPAEKQDLLFEPFFRAHTDTAFDSGGLGLGLYVARAIAVLHGGDVDFVSKEGEGSTFTLSLPLRGAG